METAVLVFVAAVLLVIGVPVGISIGMGILAVTVVFNITQVQFLAQTMYSGFDSLPLTAIPCFMLAGAIMETGGLSKRLINVANKMVGNTTGALGTVTVLACMLFGAMSGSGPATVAAIGAIMIPHMIRAKYEDTYASALTAVAGGVGGIIIPPSIPLVIYGVATNTSIGDLFLAGIGPALVIGMFLIATNILQSRKKGYTGSGEAFNAKELLKAFWDAKFALIMPVIILGGIYGGIFTPTEAAVVSIVYGLVIGIFVYKELTWKRVIQLLSFNNSFVGGIMLTFAPAAAMGAILALLGIPNALTNFLFSISDNKIIILLIVNVFLVIMGLAIDTTSANIIFSPILLAALRPYGIDPVHLGLIITINLAIGFCTPPVCANIFVVSGMTRIPVDRIIPKAVPFLIAMFIVMLIVTFVPAIPLGLLWLLGR